MRFLRALLCLTLCLIGMPVYGDIVDDIYALVEGTLPEQEDGGGSGLYNFDDLGAIANQIEDQHPEMSADDVNQILVQARDARQILGIASMEEHAQGRWRQRVNNARREVVETAGRAIAHTREQVAQEGAGQAADLVAPGAYGTSMNVANALREARHRNNRAKQAKGEQRAAAASRNNNYLRRALTNQQRKQEVKARNAAYGQAAAAPVVMAADAGIAVATQGTSMAVSFVAGKGTGEIGQRIGAAGGQAAGNVVRALRIQVPTAESEPELVIGNSENELHAFLNWTAAPAIWVEQLPVGEPNVEALVAEVGRVLLRRQLGTRDETDLFNREEFAQDDREGDKQAGKDLASLHRNDVFSAYFDSEHGQERRDVLKSLTRTQRVAGGSRKKDGVLTLFVKKVGRGIRSLQAQRQGYASLSNKESEQPEAESDGGSGEPIATKGKGKGKGKGKARPADEEPLLENGESLTEGFDPLVLAQMALSGDFLQQDASLVLRENGEGASDETILRALIVAHTETARSLTESIPSDQDPDPEVTERIEERFLQIRELLRESPGFAKNNASVLRRAAQVIKQHDRQMEQLIEVQRGAAEPARSTSNPSLDIDRGDDRAYDSDDGSIPGLPLQQHTDPISGDSYPVVPDAEPELNEIEFLAEMLERNEALRQFLLERQLEKAPAAPTDDPDWFDVEMRERLDALSEKTTQTPAEEHANRQRRGGSQAVALPAD